MHNVVDARHVVSPGRDEQSLSLSPQRCLCSRVFGPMTSWAFGCFWRYLGVAVVTRMYPCLMFSHCLSPRNSESTPEDEEENSKFAKILFPPLCENKTFKIKAKVTLGKWSRFSFFSLRALGLSSLHVCASWTGLSTFWLDYWPSMCWGDGPRETLNGQQMSERWWFIFPVLKQNSLKKILVLIVGIKISLFSVFKYSVILNIFMLLCNYYLCISWKHHPKKNKHSTKHAPHTPLPSPWKPASSPSVHLNTYPK